MIGDYEFSCGVDHLAKSLADITNVYKYQFAVRSPVDPWPKWSDVKHGDEMDYLFGRPIALNNSLFTEEHKKLSKFMINTWANFVKHGYVSFNVLCTIVISSQLIKVPITEVEKLFLYSLQMKKMYQC